MNKINRRKSFNIRKTIKALLSCWLCLLMLVLPLACQKDLEPEALDPEIDLNDNIIPSIIPGTEEATSSLRLRYHDEGNLNPLRKHSYSTEAIFTLVYDSLFAYDAAGALHKDLAADAVFSDDELIWTIRLRNVNFHSGEKLTSSDVEASLRFWLSINLNHEPEVLYKEDLPSSPDNEDDTEEVSDTEDTSDIQDSEAGEEDDPDLHDEDEETTVEPPKSGTDDEFDYYIDTPVLGEPAKIDLLSGTLSVSLDRGRLIQAIGRPTTDTMQIKLREKAPILDLLTFPIVPATNVESSSYQLIPGTGKFRINKRDDNGHLFLSTTSDDDIQITEIIAYNCAGVTEALTLFENKDLDILLLGREEASRLRERSRVRSQDYMDSGFVSLYVPDINLKTELQTVLLSTSNDYLSTPFPHTDYYIRSGDFRLLDQNDFEEEMLNPFTETVAGNQLTNPSNNDSDNNDKESVEDRPVYHVLMPRVYYPLGLQSKLTSLISKNGGKAEYIMVEAEDYQHKLTEGNYDIALLLDESASYADPLDYALALSSLKLINDLGISGEQFAILENGRYLQAEILESDDGHEAGYFQAVHELFTGLPVIGVCSTSTLVWYRDGVEGILNGTAELPYEGVESIRVWQP